MSMDFTKEQLAAIETINCNVSVSAGAGSGKTRVLVERFLYILEQARQKNIQADAASIGAITFTRKAAGEMRSRLRKGMLERQQRGDTDGFWARQLSALDRAHISTIDSLCSAILKENPVEAELDPGFTITDELDLDIFQAQVLDEFLDKQFEAKNPAVFKLFSQYGYESLKSQLLALVDDLPELCQEQDFTAPYRERLAKIPDLQKQFLLQIRILSTNRDIYVKSKKTATYAKLQDLESNFATIEQELNKQPMDFSSFQDIVKGMRISNSEGKEVLAKAKACVAELELLNYDQKALELLPAWQEIIQSLGAVMAQRQAELEQLGFGDVARRALELLKFKPEVRKRYEDKFTHLMVDEFQDTDDLQRQLIYLLCGSSSEELQGRKLFIVGDPKQSIYGFRGADVSVFKRVQQDILATGGVNLQLSKNFRSLDKVLDLVNDTFIHVMGNNPEQDVVFESLDYERLGEEVDKPVLFELQYDDSYDKTVSGDIYALEAQNLVNTLVKLHQEGQSYGEMAVLLRTMSKVHYLTKALQGADVPFDLVDGKGFYQQQEVLDLLNFFTYLENPARRLELVGVLRSPYVGLTDNVLTSAILGEKCLDALVPNAFQKLVISAKLLPLPLLWEEVWQKLQVEKILLAQELGENKLENVKKLRQLALDFAQQGAMGTLRGWLEHVRTLRSAEARETTANLDRTDAVTVMTIHKAKGLEYKTVFVPFLAASGMSDAAMLAYKKGLGLGISVGISSGNPVFGGTEGFAPSGVLTAIREYNKAKEQEEKARVLYVAMTRAEDRLLMSGICKVDQKSSSDDGRAISEMHSWFNQLLSIATLSEAVEHVALPVEEIAKCNGAGREEREQEMPLVQVPEAKLPHYKSWGRKLFSPSTLQAYEHCPRAFYYEELLGLPRLAQTALENHTDHTPASIIGLVIHKTLELYQEETGAYEELKIAYEDAVAEEGKGYDTSKAWAMLQSYVASPLGTSIPKNHQRELEFFYEVEGLTLNGIVDCIYENSDGTLTIVDYKTGNPPEPDEVKLGYAWQLAIYKASVERMTGKTVKTCELHFLQNNSVWRLPEGSSYYDEAVALCVKLHNAEDYEEFSCKQDNCQWCDYEYLCPCKKYTL